MTSKTKRSEGQPLNPADFTDKPEVSGGQKEMPVWSGVDKNLKDRIRLSSIIPGTSRTNKFNMIVIVADTWRADHLGVYGNRKIKTPNLDKLAEQSVIFKAANAEALPTIPCRKVYHTGKSGLPDAIWQPLGEDEITLAEILKEYGFITGFITDTYHYFKPGYNFHRGFDSWEWIRGQEKDKWKVNLRGKYDTKKHISEHLWNDEFYDEFMSQYLANTEDRKDERDYYCATMCDKATEWLERNANSNRPFMLWIDMFDPHEPWDAPTRFKKMYRNEYPCDRYLFGYGINNEDIRPDDLAVIRDLYAAEITFSDFCIGRLIDRLEESKLMDDTIVVFTTDHGTHLGEEGCVQKTPALLNKCITHIPLIIRHPDNSYAGKSVSALVSAVDFMSTFLCLLGIGDYKGVDGKNMWKLVKGEVESIHDHVYSVFADFGAVIDLDWYYFQRIKERDPHKWVPWGDGPNWDACLYDLKKDPDQRINVVKEFPEIAKSFRNKLACHLNISFDFLDGIVRKI